MSTRQKVRIGVIGGSGLYEMKDLKNQEKIQLTTPFGEPSDKITIGSLEGVKVAFLPRHGQGHRLLPGELNYRANIYSLKSLGVEWIISVSAVGSMKEEILPLDIVIPDQIFDRTKGRASSFLGNGLVGHISFADPFCAILSELLYDTVKETGRRAHKGGTYICIEGPQFSTKAESRIYRQWGVDIIGMTALPEAKLAREAEICYATLALVTDYDVWHATEEKVSAEMVVMNLLRNIETAKTVLKKVIPKIPKQRTCECATALSKALVTDKNFIPAKIRQDLKLILGKYLNFRKKNL